ncbi:MAG: hypothetical protein HYT48_00240 [Candidatus Vogelbacteria bacterium]|nr:hypothetical protein [Candidatus Vogelbacteria bacterium]
MNKVMIQNKITSLEAEFALLKKAVTPQPDFNVDESNWKKLKPSLKRARAKTYRRVYG